jgi:hypothetical protein
MLVGSERVAQRLGTGEKIYIPRQIILFTTKPKEMHFSKVFQEKLVIDHFSIIHGLEFEPGLTEN